MALSTFSENIGDKIADALMEGESLVRICKKPGMPNRRTVIRWMEKNPDFASLIARARLYSADAMADRIQAITDSMLRGILTPEQARVASSNLMWHCGKLNQGRYGDKLNLEHSGTVNHTANPAEFLSTGTLEAIERELSLSASNEPILTAEVVDVE